MTNHTEALHRAAAALRYCLTVVDSNDPLYRKIAATEHATRAAALSPEETTENIAEVRPLRGKYEINPHIPDRYELRILKTGYVHLFNSADQLVEFANHEKIHVTNHRMLPAHLALDLRF